jgi:hypothetical protein
LNDWDRALLELCVVHPELIGTLATHIPVEELQTETARTLFTLLAQLACQHPALTFAHIMSTIEEPSLKNLLVELDERGSNKAELVNRPSEYLQHVLHAFQRRRIDHECRREIQHMESMSAGEKAQLDSLERILKRRREQQGI